MSGNGKKENTEEYKKLLRKIIYIAEEQFGKGAMGMQLTIKRHINAFAKAGIAPDLPAYAFRTMKEYRRYKSVMRMNEVRRRRRGKL